MAVATRGSPKTGPERKNSLYTMAAEEEAGGHTAVFLVFCEHALFFLLV